MNVFEVVKTLEDFNEWMRGNNDVKEPYNVGIAIDEAARMLKIYRMVEEHLELILSDPKAAITREEFELVIADITEELKK